MKKITLLISALMLIAATTVAQGPWEIGYPIPSALKATYGYNKDWKIELRISGTGEMRDFGLGDIYERPGDPETFCFYWHGVVSNIVSSDALVIEEGITKIGEYAFYLCRGLKGLLTIPNNVTTIGNDAFRGCSGFSGSLTIPASVTKIGRSAFEGCSGLSSVTIPEGITEIGSRTFYYCIGLNGSLTIPASVTKIGRSAFEDCRGLSSVSIPESVTTIEDRAFLDCSGLTTVNNYAIEPQSINQEVFRGLTLSNITLNVPVLSLALYQDADVWQEFKIVGLYHKIKATADNEEHGTVSADAWYKLGNSASLTAVPAKGYEFVNWTKDGTVVSSKNPYTFPVTEDAELTANFQGLTVSLNDIQADNTSIIGYYSILGEKLPHVPQSGMYIVMYANGKTEKVRAMISK